MWYNCHQHCMNVECRRDLRYSRNMWGGTAGFRLSWNEILMHLTLALYTNEPGWSLIQVHTSVGEEEASRIIQKQGGQLRLEQVLDLRTSCTETWQPWSKLSTGFSSKYCWVPLSQLHHLNQCNQTQIQIPNRSVDQTWILDFVFECFSLSDIACFQFWT